MATPRRGVRFMWVRLPWIVGAMALVGIPASSGAQVVESTSAVDDGKPSVVVELRARVPYDFELLRPPAPPRPLAADAFRQQEGRPGSFVFWTSGVQVPARR